LRLEQRGVEAKRIGRVLELGSEILRALPALHEGGRALGDDGHEIFSMFTRNALNSGVRAPTSPTNGVSAFASQFFESSGFFSAETPMKPQWIGMPIVCTVFPAIVCGPSRFVTSAATSSLPRMLDTRTRSPLLMPFSLSRSSALS